jgi:rhodanese-related sulfurtransferase
MTGPENSAMPRPQFAAFHNEVQSLNMNSMFASRIYLHGSGRILRAWNPLRSKQSTMSLITISSLTQMSRERLAELILSTPPPNLAIVDVRDSDHIGGHIKDSTWIPSNTLDFRLPELLRTLKDKDQVIFHCALSQQRGPSAALKYARGREELAGKLSGGVEKKHQEVCVLVGGFSMWQAKYGEDERLTEGYVKDIWDD